ncbi:unnamed protein product [Lactuca saligna]|uniref:Uncharacterized protein n=1 Tax=Lactuca saligna TaxID=75948 RepID=A0AA35YTQ0_LACSI|nr:unnamed protein product [Lactuca saligna]
MSVFLRSHLIQIANVFFIKEFVCNVSFDHLLHVPETKYKTCGLEKEKKIPPRIKVLRCTHLGPLNLKYLALSNYCLQSTDYKLTKHGNDIQEMMGLVFKEREAFHIDFRSVVLSWVFWHFCLHTIRISCKQVNNLKLLDDMAELISTY